MTRFVAVTLKYHLCTIKVPFANLYDIGYNSNKGKAVAMRCEGITKQETQCKNKAMDRSKYCRHHRPKIKPIEEVGQCQANTKAGPQCKRPAEEGDIYCYQHQPSAKNLDLSDRQKLFCEEYMSDMIATSAALRAGYAKSSADVVGCNLLKNVKVKAYIEQLKEQKRKKLGIRTDSILEEIAKIAFIDITDFVDINEETTQIDDNGVLIIDKAKIKDLTELKHKTSAIQSIKETKYGIEIKTHAKVRMLEKLYDHVAVDKNANERLKLERERIELERERIILQRERSEHRKIIEEQKLKLEEYKAGVGKSDMRPINIVNDLPIPESEEGDANDSKTV